LRDNFQALTEKNVKIFGVSTQDAESHQQFIEKHDLPFALVVDDGKVAAAFGVPVRLGFASRQSFLVGADGKMVAIWRDVDPAGHAAEVLAAVPSSG
jgi:peroxiredoxin Q/BCP